MTDATWCPIPVVKRAIVLIAFALSATAPDAAVASCVRTIPFLQIAKNADFVFIGRIEKKLDVTVLEVVRSTEAKAASLSAFGWGAPGTKWLFALSHNRATGAYFVPRCGEGRLAIAGEWALGTIIESRTIWWQAAPLRDVLQAVITGEASLKEALDPYNGIPLVSEARELENIRVKVDPDCNVTTPKATVRVLMDDEGFIVRSMPVKGIARCVDGALSAAIGSARLDPPRPDGLVSAAWIDLVVPLPYTPSAAACSRGHAMRPRPRSSRSTGNEW